MIRTFALLALTLAAACLQTAHACQLRPHSERVDVFVLYGQVVGHVEERVNGKPAWGIEIAPRHELRMIARTGNGFYTIFPTYLSSDCGDVHVPSREEIENRYPLGSVMQIVGEQAAATSRPGDISTHYWGVLAPLPVGCTVENALRVEHGYRDTAPACVDYRFEANKDLARLETAGPQERSEILARLADYAHSLDYADLVGAHVPDPREGERLLRLRYGDITEQDCLADTEARRAMDAERRERLVERCRQRNPYARPDRWNLYDAIRLGRINVVREYLASGGNAKAPIMGTPMGAAIPLDVAVRARQDEIAVVLLEAGAELAATSLSIEDVLKTALPQTLRWLLAEDPAFRNQVPDFAIACENGRAELIDIVLDHARENRLDASAILTETVTLCINERAADIARALLDRGAPITDDHLFAAALSGSPGMTRFLLQRGANPNAVMQVMRRNRDEGGTPMDLVWRQMELRPTEPIRLRYVLHELAAAGGTMRARELPEGAARNGSAEIEAGKSDEERLVIAADIGFYDVVERLLADNELEQDVLTEAARKALRAGNPEVARLLLAAGADPNGGLLHDAVAGNQTAFIVHLAEVGADFNAPVSGKSPLAVWHEQPLAGTHHDALHALKFGGADFCAYLAALAPGDQATSAAYASATSTVQAFAPECSVADR